MKKTRADLVKMVYKNYEFKSFITKDVIAEVVDATFDAMTDILVADDELIVRGFGRLYNRVFKGRRGYNILEKKVMDYPDTKVPCYEPTQKLRIRIKETVKNARDKQD